MGDSRDLSRLAAAIEKPVSRLVSTAVNGFEYVRFGGLRTEADASPFDVVTAQRVYRLRHYFPDAPGDRPIVLLVPPLMQSTEVWDISPDTSAVRMLHDQGIDPWVVDFGDPEQEPGGAQRDFTDHVLAVSGCVDIIHQATGRDVHLLGYSQGGLFCYQAAAYRRGENVASAISLGTPMEFSVSDKYLPERLLWQLAELPQPIVRRTGLPRRLISQGFQWSQPQRTIKNRVSYLLALHDREALLPREPQRKFLEGGAWVKWPGPALTEFTAAARDDRFRKGGLVYGDRSVGTSDLSCPLLIVVGTADTFGSVDACRQIVHAAPRADVWEMILPVGHFGLPVSGHARKKTWPGVAAWARWVEKDGELPDYIEHVDPDSVTDERPSSARGLTANLTYGAGLAVGAGLSAPRTLASAAQRAAGTAWDLTSEVIEQAPQLLRLERLRPGTRISYGKLVADLSRRRPDDVCFLFNGRAHTFAAAQGRIDNVVRGFISLGVRRGDRVGVLMDSRPSALSSVTALNRLGAVAVLLRPGSDTAREAELAGVKSVVTDPENAAEVLGLGLTAWVLGGGAERLVPAGAVDMERIDPQAVSLPSWYRPDPGRARDLAFILFTGEGARIGVMHITNGRWALSALAAASASKLTAADTVYSVNPLYHPSGLLLATAGAVAGGARLAMTPRFDPDTFWTEVRRYGVTVVPYTWTMLHGLLAAEVHPEERNHPIRLFVGSGMPAFLWRRVNERFAPAAVLELYASTRTDAILGNVSGRKVGALGKPLPGTARVRIAEYDVETGRLVTGSDGFAVPAKAGETGMLLVAADPNSAEHDAAVTRGLFRADDAWVVSGDLFRRDPDDDLWFVDHTSAMIRTARGLVSPHAVEDALGTIGAVDLAVCYPVAGEDGPKVVAAVSLRPGQRLDGSAVEAALAAIVPTEQPDVVHVVDAIPVNSWYRPRTDNLRQAGFLELASVWMRSDGASD